MSAELLEGSEAIARAMVSAGCKFFAGYPMTPFTEVLEGMAKLLPDAGGDCVNAESELEAIGMAWGAAAAGARAATGSVGQGLSLMQESIAELCFAIQWAIVLRELAQLSHSDTAKNIAKLIVPLIALAECCSWYAVISTNFLGNVLENSLWTVTFTLIAIALARVALSFRGIAQWAIAATAAGALGYVIFMSTIDVPMYFGRWQAEIADGTQPLGLLAGLYDVATRWVVSHNIADWHQEILWMSLYFSAAVWASLLLGGFPLVKNRLPHYRVRRPLLKPARRPLVIS